MFLTRSNKFVWILSPLIDLSSFYVIYRISNAVWDMFGIKHGGFLFFLPLLILQCIANQVDDVKASEGYLYIQRSVCPLGWRILLLNVLWLSELNWAQIFEPSLVIIVMQTNTTSNVCKIRDWISSVLRGEVESLMSLIPWPVLLYRLSYIRSIKDRRKSQG